MDTMNRNTVWLLPVYRQKQGERLDFVHELIHRCSVDFRSLIIIDYLGGFEAKAAPLSSLDPPTPCLTLGKVDPHICHRGR